MAWNLKLGWPSCDESEDGKENRGLRSKPSYSYGCLAIFCLLTKALLKSLGN